MIYLFLVSQEINCQFYIPDRYEEGYGLSKKGIDFAFKEKISLIITLDCGIRAVKQVNYANKKGIDIIICDHHNPGTILPEAHTILNPKQIDCNYPFKDLWPFFKLVINYFSPNRILYGTDFPHTLKTCSYLQATEWIYELPFINPEAIDLIKRENARNLWNFI